MADEKKQKATSKKSVTKKKSTKKRSKKPATRKRAADMTEHGFRRRNHLREKPISEEKVAYMDERFKRLQEIVALDSDEAEKILDADREERLAAMTPEQRKLATGDFDDDDDVIPIAEEAQHESGKAEWRPFPRQEFALLRNEFEILYGGARGGGKSDCGIVWLLGDEYEPGKLYIHHPRYRALVLRKNSNDLSDWLDRAAWMYRGYGASVVGNPPMIKFPSGAIFRTGHLKNRESYEKFLGHEYQRLLIEELTQIPDEKYYVQILGSVRSTVEELMPQIFCTSNPGGVGHLWVRNRFIQPAPPDTPFSYTEQIGDRLLTRSRIFIPAKVDDNPILTERDPGYLLYLEQLKETDPTLYEAWRHGNWDVFAGQFFGEFSRSTHVLPYKPFRSYFTRIGGIDWGYTAPFVFLASVVLPIEHTTERGDTIKFNRVITYNEIDGTRRAPEEWAAKIKEVEGQYFKNYAFIRCDPSMFNKSTDGSDSISRQMKSVIGERYGYLFKPASNDRVGGWAVMRKWLSIAPDGLPYWMVMSNCNGLINTLPTQVHDESKVEDIDQSSRTDHHCFCRHVPILTSEGYKPIHEVCLGEKVWTPIGWSTVLEVQQNGVQNVTSFRGMKVTENHPFLTKDGFLPLKLLTDHRGALSVYISEELRIGVTLNHLAGLMRATFAVAMRVVEANRGYSINMSGDVATGTFHKVSIFITKMRTLAITILKILRWSVIPSIMLDIRERTLLPLEKISKLLKRLPRFGTSRMQRSRFTNGWERFLGKTKRNIVERVIPVVKPTRHTMRDAADFVATTVECSCSGGVEVWNLKTDTGMYIANNAVVSNCDAARYMLKHVRFIDARNAEHDTIETKRTLQLGLIDSDKMAVKKQPNQSWKTV